MTGDDSWLKLPKSMGAGDPDGDGVDEIFIAYLIPSEQVGFDKELRFRVIKKINGAYPVIAEGTVENYLDDEITEYGSRYMWLKNFNVVCGDVDGNRQSEILIAFNKSIFLIGGSSKDYGIRRTISYQFFVAGNVKYPGWPDKRNGVVLLP